jgi:hypothetical protein
LNKKGYIAMFIKIYNSFITINSKNKLTANELYIYCYLFTLRTYEDRVLTNYDILCEENTFYKNKSDNKKEIRKCITSIMEKELIDLEEQNKSLSITFSFEEEGHVQLPFDKFRSFTEPRDLYIYVAVRKWDNNGGARYSNNNWADLLDITREHAIKVIEDACKRGIIYKKIGTYTSNLIGSRNQKIQEINTYSTMPFAGEKFSIDQDNSEVMFGSVKELSTFGIIDLNNNEEAHNWKNNNNLTVDDFVFYLSNQSDKEIKKMCEKKLIRIISKNEKFKFVRDKLMTEAEEIIASNNRIEKEKIQIQINKEIESMIKQTGDIVLQTNNGLVPYQEYCGKGNDIIKVFYLEKVDISDEVGVTGAYTLELRSRSNTQDIDIYRKEDGQWRDKFSIENELYSCNGI